MAETTVTVTLDDVVSRIVSKEMTPQDILEIAASLITEAKKRERAAA